MFKPLGTFTVSANSSDLTIDNIFTSDYGVYQIIADNLIDELSTAAGYIVKPNNAKNALIKSFVYNTWINNLETITYRGVKFLIPGPIDEYLTYEYGDWRTPVRWTKGIYQKGD